jgi:hypothetical protein
METFDQSGERLLVEADEWLELLRREYLAEYVRAGGSAVKVLSGSDERLLQVACRVREMATREGYFFAELDPSEPDAAGKRKDLHRMDKFFFEATRGVEWKEWAAAQARRYLEERGIRLAGSRALSDLEGIAADNGRDPQDLLNQYQRELATPQIRDHGMAVEFRTAVTALGRAQLVPDAVTPTTEEVLLAWFAGRTMPGASAALKKIQIYERINQANARHMLASFCRWLPRTGHAGLVLVLDLRPYEHKRVTKTRRQAQLMERVREAVARGAASEELAALMAGGETEPAVAYSDKAYMQMLTMVRRFIDEIDWFERLLLVILTTPKFYDHASPRNYFNYDALQTRVGLEVHDARRANPAAALVHLGEAA